MKICMYLKLPKDDYSLLFLSNYLHHSFHDEGMSVDKRSLLPNQFRTSSDVYDNESDTRTSQGRQIFDSFHSLHLSVSN